MENSRQEETSDSQDPLRHIPKRRPISSEIKNKKIEENSNLKPKGKEES